MFSKYFLRHNSVESFSIRIHHVVWNYSLVYMVLFGVMHFLSIRFCLRLVWLLSIADVFCFHSLLFFIHFKPYIFYVFLVNSLIWILLKKIHLILISNLLWKYTFEISFWIIYFILCSCKLKIVYSLYFILFSLIFC